MRLELYPSGEQRYATTEKEALAFHYATEHFRFRFKIATDHSALKRLSSIEPK